MIATRPPEITDTSAVSPSRRPWHAAKTGSDKENSALVSATSAKTECERVAASEDGPTRKHRQQRRYRPFPPGYHQTAELTTALVSATLARLATRLGLATRPTKPQIPERFRIGSGIASPCPSSENSICFRDSSRRPTHLPSGQNRSYQCGLGLRGQPTAREPRIRNSTGICPPEATRP